MVLDILEETSIAANKAIVVGDTSYDIQMAHSANTDALAVCYGVHDRDDLKSEKPLGCVDDFSSVIDWFLK
jgi:phosphoglycolate phosphatase